MTHRLRCGECGRSRPEKETTLISGKIGGDYRRAARRGQLRVCRDCTEEHVAHVRRANAEGLRASLNTGTRNWAQAAEHFGTDCRGLRMNFHNDKLVEEDWSA